MLFVADRLEAASQRVEIRAGQLVGCGRCRLPAVRLGAPDAGEPDDSLVTAGRLGELVEQLVHPRTAFRRQGGDRLRQVLAVMICGQGGALLYGLRQIAVASTWLGSVENELPPACQPVPAPRTAIGAETHRPWPFVWPPPERITLPLGQ